MSALDALYRAARAQVDSDSDFRARFQKRVVDLQAGDAATLAMWCEIVKESEVAFQENLRSPRGLAHA